MKRKLLFLSFLFSGFVLKSTIFGFILGTILKAAIGLDIRPNKITFKSFNEILVEDINVYDNKGRYLAKVKSIDLKFDLFSEKKLEYVNVDSAEVELVIDINNKYVNWVYPFDTEPEYLEEETKLSVPSLGDITVTNSSLTFIDNSYKRPYKRKINNISALIEFDSKDNAIKIDVEGSRDKEIYKANVVVRDEVLVNINLKDIVIDEEVVLFTRAEEFLTLKEGFADLQLQIYDSELSGDINFRDVVLENTIIDATTNASGSVSIKDDFVQGNIKAKIDDSYVDIKLRVDIDREILILTANSSKIPVPFLAEKVNALKKIRIDSKGDIDLKTRVEVDIDKGYTNLQINIKSEEASVFGDKFLSCKMNASLEKDILSKLNLKCNFEEGHFYLNIDRNKSDYNLTFKGDADSEIIRFFDHDYYLPKARIVFNGHMKSDLQFDNFKGKAFTKFKGVYLFDDKLDVNFFRRKSDLTVEFSNDNLHANFFINNKNLSLSLNIPKKAKVAFDNTSFECVGRASLSAKRQDIILQGIDVNLDINNFTFDKTKVEDFAFIIKGKKNEFQLHPFNLISVTDNVEVEIENIKAEGIIDKESLSLYVTGKDLSFVLGKFINEKFNNPILSLVISESGIRLRKFSSDRFRLDGIIPFEDSLDLKFAMDKITLNSLISLSELDIQIKNNTIKFVKGGFNLSGISFPISGSIDYDEQTLYVNSLSLGKSLFNGTISENVDLSLNLAADDILIDFLKDVPFTIDLVGDFSIFGKSSSPILKGEIFVNSKMLPKINLSIGYADNKLSIGELFLIEEDKLINIDTKGEIDLSLDKMSIKILEKGINLSDIHNFKGTLDLDFALDGFFNNFKYNLLLDLQKLDTEFVRFDFGHFVLSGDNQKVELEDSYVKSKNNKIDFRGHLFNERISYYFEVLGKDILVENFINKNNRYLEGVEGICSIDLRANHNSWNGSMNIQSLNANINFKEYVEELESSFLFKNLKGDINFNEEKASLVFKSILNGGTIEGDIEYKFDNKDLYANILTKESVISLDNYFDLRVNSEWEIKESQIKGDLNILSGTIIDIVNLPSISNDEEESLLKLNELNLTIKEGVKVKLNTFLNLEKIDIDIFGDLNIKNENDMYKIKGDISSESGSIEFNKYNFIIKNIRVSFNEDRQYPYLSMLSSSSVLGKDIYLSLDGRLDSKETVVVDEMEEKEDESIFYVSLWSDDYDEDNNKLELKDILYLLSMGGSEDKDAITAGGDFLGQELSKAVLLNPLSRKVKNFFGLYQFKVSSPFFELSNIIEGDYTSILSRMKIEISTNIMRNVLFVGANTLMSRAGDDIEEINLSLFTINRWRFFFSFESPFDNILFRGLGFSKKTNFGRHEVEVGVSGFESLIISDEISFRYNLEASLRF